MDHPSSPWCLLLIDTGSPWFLWILILNRADFQYISKVQIFWEGHKNFTHLQLTILYCQKKRKMGHIFVAFSKHLKFKFQRKRRNLQKQSTNLFYVMYIWLHSFKFGWGIFPRLKKRTRCINMYSKLLLEWPPPPHSPPQKRRRL